MEAPWGCRRSASAGPSGTSWSLEPEKEKRQEVVNSDALVVPLEAHSSASLRSDVQAHKSLVAK